MNNSKRGLGAAEHNKENKPSPERSGNPRVAGNTTRKTVTPTRGSTTLSSKTSDATRSTASALNRTNATTGTARVSVRDSRARTTTSRPTPAAGQDAGDGAKPATKMSAATLKRLSNQQNGSSDTKVTTAGPRIKSTNSATPSPKSQPSSTTRNSMEAGKTYWPSSPAKRSSTSSNAQRFSTGSMDAMRQRSTSPSKKSSPRRSILEVDFAEPEVTSEAEGANDYEVAVEDEETVNTPHDVSISDYLPPSLDEHLLDEDIIEQQTNEFDRLRREHEDECRHLREIIQSTQNESERHEEAHMRQVEHNQTLKTEVQNMRGRISELSRDEARKIEFIDQLHIELDQTRRELHELQSFQYRNHEFIVKENKRLTQRNEELENQLVRIESERQREKNEVRDELDKMSKQLEEATSNHELANENEYLQAKLDRLEGEIERMQSDLKFADHHKAETERLFDEIQDMSHKLEESKSELQNRSNENLALEKQISFMEKNHWADMERLSRELGTVYQDLEDANEESSAKTLAGDSQVRQFLQEYHKVLEIADSSPADMDIRDLHYQVLDRVEILLAELELSKDAKDAHVEPKPVEEEEPQSAKEIDKVNLNQREEIRKNAHEYEEVFGLLMEGAVLNGDVLELKADNFQLAASKIPDVLPTPVKRTITPPDSGVDFREPLPLDSSSENSTPVKTDSPKKEFLEDKEARLRTDQTFAALQKHLHEVQFLNKAISGLSINVDSETKISAPQPAHMEDEEEPL